MKNNCSFIVFGIKTVLYALFFCFFAFLSVPITVAQSPNRPGKDVALFIYVSNFEQNGQGSTWSDLPTGKGEIDSIRSELVRNYGFEDRELGKNPTVDEVRTGLKAYALPGQKNIGKEDQLLVYISTHGYRIQGEGKGGLAFSNSKTPDEDPQQKTLLPYKELLSLLHDIRCKHILLIVDACFSGILDNESREDPPGSKRRSQVDMSCDEVVREALSGTTRLYFTSVGQDEKSPKESTFARRFLERLQEDDNDGIVDYYEIWSKLATHVRPKPNLGEMGEEHEKLSTFAFVRKTVCADPVKARRRTQKGFVPPPLQAHPFKGDASKLWLSESALQSELMAVSPRIEGGFAAFGYSRSVSGGHAEQPEEVSGGGGEDILLQLNDEVSDQPKLLTYGRRGDERALTGLQTFDGGYLLAGWSESNGDRAEGKKDAYLLKVDGKGQYQWHYRFGTKGDDQFNRVVQMENGTLVAAGSSDGHPLLVCLDAQGQEPRAFTNLTVRDLVGNIAAIVCTPYNDLLLTGNAGRGRNASPFLLHFDIERGEPVFQTNYFRDKYKDCLAKDVIWNAQNQILVLLERPTNTNREDGLLLRCRQVEGIFEVEKEVPFGSNASDIPLALCVDIFGDAYMAGKTKSSDNRSSTLYNKQMIVELLHNTATPGEMGRHGGNRADNCANALVFLPGRRLVAVGQNAEQAATAMRFDLKIEANVDARLYFDSQLQRFCDGETPDQRLTPGEHAWYLLRLENKGQYVTGASIEVNAPLGIVCPKKLWLPDIPAASGITVALPIEGSVLMKMSREPVVQLRLLGAKAKNNIGEPLVLNVPH